MRECLCGRPSQKADLFEELGGVSYKKLKPKFKFFFEITWFIFDGFKSN